MRWLLSTVKPELWIAAIDYWTTYLIASGIRERTIKLRRYQIGRLAEEHLNRSPWSLTTQDLTVWLARQDWAPETRKSFRSALRSFYGWAATSGRTRRDPAAGLRAVRTTAHPPKPVPDDVLDHALATASDRDRLVLLLASHAGLRCAEIAGLRWDDIGMTDNNRLSITATIRVRGKGDRVRLVPLHPRLAAELDHYGKRVTRNAYLFPGPYGPITAGHVGVICRRLLGGGWSAHSLRHRFLTECYRISHDLLLTQELAGHASPVTTRGYIKLDTDRAAEVVGQLGASSV